MMMNVENARKRSVANDGMTEPLPGVQERCQFTIVDQQIVAAVDAASC
jgi:hypothetical protein